MKKALGIARLELQPDMQFPRSLDVVRETATGPSSVPSSLCSTSCSHPTCARKKDSSFGITNSLFSPLAPPRCRNRLTSVTAQAHDVRPRLHDRAAPLKQAVAHVRRHRQHAEAHRELHHAGRADGRPPCAIPPRRRSSTVCGGGAPAWPVAASASPSTARPLPAGSRPSISAHSRTALMRPATMHAIACLLAGAGGRCTRLTSAVATAPTCVRPRLDQRHEIRADDPDVDAAAVDHEALDPELGAAGAHPQHAPVYVGVASLA